MWKSIDKAPKTKKMIAVKAIDVKLGSRDYTSDPYCVWWNENLSVWSRWPHYFEPTHFIELPEDHETS